MFNNDEIGEYFYDFGSDGVINADEVFSESNLLNIGTGTNEGLNDYSISKFSDFCTPEKSLDCSSMKSNSSTKSKVRIAASLVS